MERTVWFNCVHSSRLNSVFFTYEFVCQYVETTCVIGCCAERQAMGSIEQVVLAF